MKKTAATPSALPSKGWHGQCMVCQQGLVITHRSLYIWLLPFSPSIPSPLPSLAARKAPAQASTVLQLLQLLGRFGTRVAVRRQHLQHPKTRQLHLGAPSGTCFPAQLCQCWCCAHLGRANGIPCWVPLSSISVIHSLSMRQSSGKIILPILINLPFFGLNF